MKDAQQNITRRSFLIGLSAAGIVSVVPIKGMAAATGELKAAITGYSPMGTLDPAKCSLIAEFQTVWGIFETLLDFDEDMNIVPSLAESYHVLDNGDVEFKLREGVKFQDGEELTSEDVVFSLSRLKNPEVGSPSADNLIAVKRITPVDKYTVRLELSEPFAPLLTYLTNTRTGTQIISKKAFQKLGASEFGRQPVGTGPFKLAEWKRNQSLTFLAFKEYHRDGYPKMPKIYVPFIKDPKSGVNALLDKRVDIISEAPYAGLSRFKNGKQGIVKDKPGLNLRYIALNNKRPPFDDVHFRRALSMAFDRQVIVDAALFGQANVAHGPIPSSLAWAYDDSKPETAEFNPEKARAELAKSKYDQSATATVLTWGSDTWRRFAEIFVAQVNDTLGINLKVKVSEANNVTDLMHKKHFEAAVWGWKGLTDPDEYYSIFRTDAWRNYGDYSNAKFDDLARLARQEMDQKKRRELCIQASKILEHDCPGIFTYNEKVVSLVRPDVEGFQTTPYGGFGAQLAAVTLK